MLSPASPLPLARAACVAHVIEFHPGLDGEALMTEAQLSGGILHGEEAAAGPVEPTQVQRPAVDEVVLGHGTDGNVRGPERPLAQGSVQTKGAGIDHGRAALRLEAPMSLTESSRL